MTPFRVIVVGAGRVGLALAAELREDPGFAPVLVDGVSETVDDARRLGFEAVVCDVLVESDFLAVLRRADAVVAAVPERLVARVAAAAERVGIHHLDFSDARATGLVRREAGPDRPAVLPGSGVSPGLVDEIVEDLISGFDEVDDLVVRVGAIPRVPVGRLGYGDIWDVNGLISEYTRPAEIVVDGRVRRVAPLGRHETFEWEGRPYEAFLTADGSRSLMDLCRGRVRNAAFETIRHPGHLDHMLFLLDELGLRSRLDTLANLLRNGLPHVEEDMVLIHVTARGRVDGAVSERTAVHRILSTPATPSRPAVNALARGAASHAAALLRALATGEPARSFVERITHGEERPAHGA